MESSYMDLEAQERETGVWSDQATFVTWKEKQKDKLYLIILGKDFI